MRGWKHDRTASQSVWFLGAMYGIRTRDHWNHNPVLYQLS
jgi:hypothetical protein